jgi:protein arginine N-methyltransferase 7
MLSRHAPAGASSVVACDLQQSLCDLARKTAAANRVGRTINVVASDAGTLQRGKQVRPLGVNIVVADFFDAGGWAAVGGRVGRRAGSWGGRHGI